MKRLLAVVLNLILVCSALVVMTPAAEAAEGGPDEWGYKWTDSNSPDPRVAFNWIELDGTGTDTGLVGDDECTAPIAIGFPFEFYGNPYDMVNLTTNGLAVFDFDSTEDDNYQIPTYWASPQNFVAAFWDDLTVNDGTYNSGSVIYSTVGSAPNRQFVAEWHEVSRDYYYEQLTFEIILNETGEIWVQYLELSGETGESATVGLENYDGLLGIEYSYDSSILTNGLAVRFDQYPIGISNYQYDRAFPGDSTLFEVRVRNAQEFTDLFDVSASSEHGWTVSFFDDTMAPLVDNNLNGDPDTGDIPAGDILTFWVQVDVPPSPAEAFDVTSVVVVSDADPAVDATSTLTTEVNSAEFIEASTLDWGIDSESDGTYDLLTIYAEFDAYFDTRCYVEAYLYTAAGNYVGSDYGYVYPDVGANGVPFYFEGEEIWALGDSGQFTAYFYLYDYDWEWLDTMTYTSSYYDYTDFDSPRAYFVTPFSDSVTDLDGDTQYDVLLVDVTVQVDVQGSYYIEAYIDAGTGAIEQSTTSAMNLAVGSHVVTLDFSGFTIYYLGESGPYTVYAYLYDDIAGEWLDSANGTTADYFSMDFTDVWGAFSPPHSDYGVDVDSDGLYESLVIEVYIDVISPGEYYLYLDLYDATDTFWLLDIDTYSYLTYGANTVQFEIDAYRLVAAGYDGPYIAYVGLYTSWSWIYLDWDMHTTSAYTLDEFDPTPGVFQPPHDDYGYDADSDGTYDYLYVDVYFYAYETGYYSVTGELLDASSVTIGAYYYSGYFGDGWNAVYLEYSGGAIYTNGEDGPYTVELSLYDEWDNLLDTDAHITAAYAAGDFDAPQVLFSPPHSDSGYDEDSDGLYEWLSVNVTIEVFVDGWYEVDAYLYDQYSTYLDGAAYYNDLYIGTQTVELLFQSYDINSNAVDGPYTVELYVYDAWWYLQDSDLYTTDAYSYADFEGYGASFDTPFVGHAVDEDSDGLYDSLAVDVSVNVTTPGDYEIEMHLRTDSWDYLVTAYAGDTYDVGVTVTTLYFAGEDVFLSSHDGMFIADADLYNSEWDEVDSHAEDIGPYYYSDFVPPAAYFSPTHSDYALDEDMDGLVDYIVVNASVNVTVAGTYLVRGWLYDQWGSYVCYAEAQLYMDVGDEQAMPILFDGWFAWANGEDGTFDVYMVLSSVETGWLEDTWYTAQDYSMADFDPTPPSLVSTYTNSPPTVDGIYSAGEWDSATVVELTEADPENGLGTVMRVANNETLLFVCFDVYDDPYEDDDDSSAISFDTGNDGVATDGGEDQFTIGPAILNEQTHAVYDDGSTDWTVDCTPFQPTWPDHDGLAGAYGFGTSDEYDWYDHRIYEYAIPLALLGIAAGDEIGFVAAGIESPGVNDAFYDWSGWPKYFDDMPDLDVYGTLVTAEPYPNTDITLDGDTGWNDWYLSNVTVTLEGFGGEGGFDYSMYSVDGGIWQVYDTPFEVSGDDMHTVDYYSVDVAGNSEPVHTADVWIDTQAPTMACDLDGTTGLDGWYTSDVTATLSMDDATSGVGDAMYYLLDDMAWYEEYTDPMVVSGDGMHSIEYYTYDVAGNYFFSEALEFWIDTVGPVSYAVYEADDGNNSWLVSAAEVNITASDDTSGVAEILYSIDGGDWETYTGNFTVAVDGIIDVEYTAVDVAGNQGAVTPFTLLIDTAPPTTTASVSGDYDVTLDAVDGTSGVDYTLYSVDGVTWVVYSGEFTAGSSGVVVVEYLSVDNAGNAEDPKTLYLGDSAPPVTEAVLDGTQGTGSWYVSDVEVTLDAEDDESEVAETLYSIDGGAWTTYDDPFDVTGDGDHLVEFYSTDVAGNVEDEQSVEFSIDTVGPTTTATVDGATVTLAATDATSGVAITSYRIDAGDWVVYTGAFEVTGEGNHTVEFSSTDAAGNDEAVQTVYVEVEGGGGISVLVLGAIGLVAVLAVVGLLLFMMMRKKKGPGAPAEAPPEPQDMPPPPPQ